MSKNVKIKRKLNIKKFIRFLVIVFFMLFLVFKIYPKKTNNKDSVSPVKSLGYSSIHITKSGKSYKNYLQGSNSPWARNSYWDGTMEENGCGITCLSIIASGYDKNITPEDLRKKYYPHLDGDLIPNKIENDLELDCTDFYTSKDYINKKYFTSILEDGGAILICVVKGNDNKWTKSSHYMVLLEESDGYFYVSNPSGFDGIHLDSGWYKSDEIIPYVVKALFIK